MDDDLQAPADIRVARYYDELGVKEWLRLESDARARVMHHVHKAILSRWVRPGDRVLDAGCGPGRYSIELANLGANVTAGDISGGQIAMAQQSFAAHLRQPLPLAQFDIKALPFRDDTFDCAIALGAVLSHAAAGAEAAAQELVRVTRPGGLIVVSVLSRENYYLPYVIEQARTYGIQSVNDAIVEGRPLPHTSSIPWREFSHAELETLGKDLGCTAVSISASNVLATIAHIPLLEELEKDAELWSAFLRWEVELGRRRGNTERGAFIIAVLRKDSLVRSANTGNPPT